jgi:hypothetical protein
MASNIGTSVAVICGELRGGAAQTGRHRLTILGGDSGGGHTIAQVDVIGDASFVRRTFQLTRRVRHPVRADSRQIDPKFPSARTDHVGVWREVTTSTIMQRRVHGTSGRCCSMKRWCNARTASFARSSDTIQVMRNDEVAVPAGTMPIAFNVAAPMRTLS